MLSRTWIRIALSYAVLVLLTAGILAFLLGNEFEKREEEALRSRLADQARAVAFDAAPLFAQDAPAEAMTTLSRQWAQLLGTRVTLIRPGGVVAGDSEQDPAQMENHSSRPEVVSALADPAAPASSSRLSATVGRRLLYVAVAVTNLQEPSRVLGVARVAYPMTSVEQARNSLVGNLILTVLLASLPAAILGTLLARSIVGPLSELRSVASRFGKGDLAARARVNNGEIGELGREFNATADRLRATIEERTRERNQMAAVLAHMHDGIIITDAQGRIESINFAAARLFRTTLSAAVGRSLIELTHEHELHEALRSALAARTEQPNLEIRLDTSTVVAFVASVPNPDAVTPMGLVVLQDVTELRRLERARRDFVANIGHELRTPLASVKILVETLETAVHDDPASAKDFLHRIDVELDGLTQLVRELLELSRIESGQAQLNRGPVSLPVLLESAASRLRPQVERSGLNLAVEFEDGLPSADADAERVEQVLVNLLHNAVKFTQPGGQITLRANLREGMLCISVSDTGIGIPPEELPRIFERFYKVDKARSGKRDGEGGTGLGLAIAKHIVQAHGGQIWAESQVERGTTFYFTLPVSVVPQPA